MSAGTGSGRAVRRTVGVTRGRWLTTVYTVPGSRRTPARRLPSGFWNSDRSGKYTFVTWLAPKIAFGPIFSR